MIRKKGGKEAVKEETKQAPTEEVKAEVTESVNGSVDGSNELLTNIAPINQPSENLPVLFQAETETLPMPSQLRSLLDPAWKPPINWGFDEWVAREEELNYWSEGIGRLDARLYRLEGESLWFIWDWFRRRRVEVKEQGLKLKDEPITWMGLHEKKRWDRATTGRKIRFYLKHKDTPDAELSGQSITSMWEPDTDHIKEPPRLGSCWMQSSSSRVQLCDERGNSISKQMDLRMGVISEVVDFNDDRTQNCLMRIRTGIHAGKHFRARGIHLSNPVPLEKVPDLQKAIEDARPKKVKAKGKGKGGVPVTKPPEDAPEQPSHQEQPPPPPTKEASDQGDQIIQTTTWTSVDEQPPLSEDFNEGLAQLVSFMAFLERFKPTLHEYTLMVEKLDEVCSYFDEMQESLQDAPPPEALQTVD
jgi:hypothetical protein